MKRVKILLCISLIFTFVSCKDWLDVNVSPDAPTTTTCEEVLSSLLFFSVQGVYDFTEYATYLDQCLTTGGRTPSSTTAYKAGWGGFLEMNRHPQWRRHYYDIGVNVQYMTADAESKGARNYILIGRTLSLNSLMLTTDLFGEMPRSDAYKSNTPAYDSQEDIYAYMEQEFKDLLALYDDSAWIACPTNGVIDVRRDRMFSGDMGKWRAFTKALYARLLIRQLPNWNNDAATCDRIIAAVDDALNDPSWQEPIYKFDGGSAEQNCQWGPSQPKMNLGWAQARANLLNEAIPSKFFASILGFYPQMFSGSRFALDPRAARMMSPREDGQITRLKSLENNIGMANTDKINYFPDLYCTKTKTNPYTRDDGYIAFITEEELLFIKAEAQYWKGQKTESYNTMCSAVERSFERYSVRGNLGAMENTIIDLFYKVRLPAATFSIADLMQQKYVAMYLQPEQWTDMRRYNFSSETNGIMYDGVYVYKVERVHDGKTTNPSEKRFVNTFDLRRPYNIYEPHWMTVNDQGVNFKLSPNAWLNRISPDPETEEKYNRDQLEALGAYKNPDWLRRRMIWQKPQNTNAVSGGDNVEWL